MERKQMWVGCQWVEADPGQLFPAINPSNGEVLGLVPLGGAFDVDRAGEAARKAFGEGVKNRVGPRENSTLSPDEYTMHKHIWIDLGGTPETPWKNMLK